MTIMSPLKDGTTFTNEMQAENLQNQSETLGIKKISQPDEEAEEGREQSPAISYDERIEIMRQYAKQLEAQRREIDKEKNKSVTLPGTTPRLLPTQSQGSPIEEQK